MNCDSSRYKGGCAKRTGVMNMKKSFAMKGFILGTMLLGFIAISHAQESLSDMRRDLDDLKQSQQIIIKELQSIKAFLSTLPVRPPGIDVRGMEIDLRGKPLIGRSKTNLLMIEISDYQCSYCGRYARETYPEIKKLYVDGNNMDYAVFDLPLPSHNQALKAAQASHCAEDQGKFWEMHTQLMAKQDMLDNLSSYAVSLNLDLPKFQECLSSNKHSNEIAMDVATASRLGITGVPGFVLAARDPQNPSKVKGIRAIRGAVPLSTFRMEIDQALKNLPK